MKTLITTNFLILISLGLFGQRLIKNTTAGEGTITVTLIGLDSDDGQLMVALYDSSDTWLKKDYRGKVTQISGGTAEVTFENVPYGIYAISSFHDENSNDKLDTGLFGIPKEPYASSREAKGIFGPPRWDDAQFEIRAQQSTELIKF